MRNFIADLLVLLTLTAILARANAAEIQALELTGEWRPGAMVVGRTEPGTRVYFGPRELKVDESGRFVVGLDRDAGGSVSLRLQNGHDEQTYRYHSLHLAGSCIASFQLQFSVSAAIWPSQPFARASE